MFCSMVRFFIEKKTCGKIKSKKMEFSVFLIKVFLAEIIDGKEREKMLFNLKEY